jgi:bifunctional DNA-binding transcriptional regulator/antitoxin component of YhaV-PrlF toxin-antitoxin module
MLRRERGIVMDVLTLDQFGRLHFPEAVRTALGLTDVTQLRLEVQNEQIVLTPVVGQMGASELPIGGEGILESRDGIWVIGGELEGDTDILHAIREERIQGLMGL